jgi:hypothetical protein
MAWLQGLKCGIGAVSKPKTALGDGSLALELLRALEDWHKSRGAPGSVLTEATAYTYSRSCDRLANCYQRFRRGGAPSLTLVLSLERALEKSLKSAGKPNKSKHHRNCCAWGREEISLSECRCQEIYGAIK